MTLYAKDSYTGTCRPGRYEREHQRHSSMRRLLAGALLSVGLAAAPLADAAYKPHVAVVSCEESYAEDWYNTQGSNQGLVGLAGLVGVPYDTLTLTEFLASPASSYTSVWFARCLYVNNDRIGSLVTRLGSHIAAGGSVFFDAPLAIAYRNGGVVRYRPMNTTFPALGITDRDWQPMQNATVRTTGSAHPVAVRFGLPPVTNITQGIATDGFESFSLTNPGAPGSDVLLEVLPAAGGTPVPYLVVSTATGGAKVLGASAYAASGAAAPFRSESPAGFYDNRLMPYLVETLSWLVGPETEPFVSLQLSHAPMTVVARLDGDVSDQPKPVQGTLDYLIDLGKRTGVTTVYGIVSNFAESGKTWNQFAASGPGLQQLGGSIGSHSSSHPDNMNKLMDQEWSIQVDKSLQNIRTGLTGTDPEAYAFINPGETIRSEYYGRFFGAIKLFMTHGFETMVPYSSGVMGFGLGTGVDPKPIISNVASPDYQWLYYDPWIYTVAEATAAQKKILTWFQERVGRGVLYNEMWHDYGIGESIAPFHNPQDSPRPLYNANRDHFAQNRIYAPAVHELIGKMYLAKGSKIVSAMSGDELRATVDTSALPAAYRDDAAGMGLRVNASTQPITAVTLNGAPYHAFSSHTVILPPAAATQELGIRFGAPTPQARLTYISKAFSSVALNGETLTVALRQPGLMTRFCFASSPAYVVLSADAFRRSGEELCGELRYGAAARSIAAQHVDTGATGLHVTGADRPITAATWSPPTMTISLAAGASGQLDLETTAIPESITVNGQTVQRPTSPGPFSIAVADPSAATVVIDMPASPADLGADAAPSSPLADGGPTIPPTAPGEAIGCACTTVGTSHSPLGALPLAGLLAALAALARVWCRRAA